MPQTQTSLRRTWAILIAGPLLFLAAIVVVAMYYGAVTGGDAQAIADRTPQAMPIIPVAVQVLLLLLLAPT